LIWIFCPAEDPGGTAGLRMEGDGSFARLKNLGLRAASSHLSNGHSSFQRRGRRPDVLLGFSIAFRYMYRAG
jgi:hypothetical protein